MKVYKMDLNVNRIFLRRFYIFLALVFVVLFMEFIFAFEVNYNQNLLENFSYLNVSDGNLSLHFSFDIQENSSTNLTLGSSSYFHNGTLGNSTIGTQPVWNSSGYIGGAYTFDGSNDYIDVDNGFILNYPFTFSGFFRTNSTGTVASVGSNSSSVRYYTLSVVSGGKVAIGVRNDSSQHLAYSDDSYSDNEWHGFSAMFVNDSYRGVYIDGLSVINDSYGSSFLTSNKLSLGARTKSVMDGFFNGSIDEFLVFNRTLNISEVQQLLFIDYTDNPLIFNVTVHNRSSYKRNFDSIDFNFEVNRTYYNSIDPINHSDLNFTAEYSYDGVTWYNITNSSVLSSFNISAWSGCFGDSLTSTAGRWPPTHDGYANTNLSWASGSYLQKGNPGWTCDEIINDTLPGNFTNNTVAFIECGTNDVNSNYNTGLSESENIAEIMADYSQIVAMAQERNITLHFINLVAPDYTQLTGDIDEIDDAEMEKYRVVTSVNSQSYDYYVNNEHNGTIISYSDVWTPLVDPSNNISVLPAYGTNNSAHPSTEGNLVYADAVWSNNYKHQRHEELYATFYPQYPTQVKFRFNVTHVTGSAFYETGYYTLEFDDNEGACTSSGRYWYSNSCNVNPQATTTTSTTSTGGSSGIGGVYRPSEKNFEGGYNLKISKNQRVEIPLGDSSKEILVKDVLDDKVVLEVGDEDYEILNSTSGKIDLDGDGFYDVEIFNKGSIDGAANLEFVLIHEEVPSQQEEGIEEENIVEKVIGQRWHLYALMGIVLILIVAWFFSKWKNNFLRK